MSDPAEDPPSGGPKKNISAAKALYQALPNPADHVHVDALVNQIRTLESSLGEMRDKMTRSNY